MVAERTARRIRVSPPVATLAIGIGFAVFTIASGIAATVFAFRDDAPVSREVFGGIPDAWIVAFYTVIPIVLVWGAWNFSLRVRNWQRGAPDRRTTTTKNVGRRLRDFRAGVYMRTLLRDPAAGLMHSLLYFGFLVLFAVTNVLEVDHQLPPGAKFLHGDVYRVFALVGDVAGLAFVAGILLAVWRRYVQRVYRIRIKTRPEHAFILGLFLVLGVSGFLTEAFRIAEAGRPSFERWSIVGWPLSGLVDGLSTSALADWHRTLWLVHIVAFTGFLVILPVTMLRHMFTSPLNLYLRDNDRPKGAMRPMPNLAETELETFGAAVVSDFHVEAAARHRRPAPCAAAAPAAARRMPPASPSTPGDRAQDRGGHGRVGQPGRLAAPRHGGRDDHLLRLGVRAHHLRGDLVVHDVPGMRRGLPGRQSRSSTRSSTCGATCR